MKIRRRRATQAEGTSRVRSLIVRIACVSVSTAAAVACATSQSEDATSTPPPSVLEGGAETTDGGSVHEAAADDASDATAPDATASPSCSSAGWCLTTLPSYLHELRLNDVWPLPGRAFAIADTWTGSVRFLEWSDATNQWSFIDDDSLHYVSGVAGGVWAPNADEVYFTLARSNAPGGEVYYGRRPVPPATDWSWKRYSLACNSVERPWVWGTSANDVFVTSCGKIHRLSGPLDGGPDGASPWVEEYVDNDPNRLLFHGATGTSPDDAWFVGWRGATLRSRMCAVVVRKTAAGYERVVDGTPVNFGCNQKAGSTAIPIAGMFGRTEGDAIHAPAKDRFVGLSLGMTMNNNVVRIQPDGAGGYAVSVSNPLPAMSVGLRSVWGTSEDDLWFLVAPPTSVSGDGFGIVRGTNIWADGGAFDYSTLVLNGVPNEKALRRVRGTSNTNIWAVGANRAFYKTTL
jgi:hypothetical protein